jgi:Protein of unknown function, DUF604
MSPKGPKLEPGTMRARYSRRGLLILAGFLLTTLIFLIFSIKEHKRNRPNTPVPGKYDELPFDVYNLELYGVERLAPSIEYACCALVVVEAGSNEPFTQHLETPLPAFRTLQLHDLRDQPISDVYSYPISIRAPNPPAPPNASHIIFGIASTLDRLSESIDAFAHWAGYTNARILAIIEPESSANIDRVRQKAVGLGVNLQIKESEAEFNDRYFSLVKVLYNERQAAQWAAFIDDDTFFLSMSALVDRLARYDPSQPYYIGSLSENFVQMSLWGFMAYGGAGIFISMPLLARMNAVFDQCNAVKWTGDRRIAQCIYLNTVTKLTMERDLHQVDLHGDQSGFYEAAGRPQPLSVHHWKSWFTVSMRQLAAVASICGNTCLLRQWRFANDWILTNGFSVVKYSQDRPTGDITMEKTWDDYSTATDDSYVHTLAPLREKDKGKVSFRLEGVDAQSSPSQVRQFYIHRDESGLGDRVLEIRWRKG